MESDAFYQEVKENRVFFDSILRIIPTGFGVVHNRVFQYINQRFCDILGYRKEELVNQSTQIIYPDEQEYERVGKLLYTPLQEKKTVELETHFKHKNGQILDILISATRNKLKNNDLSISFTATNMSKQKAAQRELEKQHQALKDQSQELQELHNKLKQSYHDSQLLNQQLKDSENKFRFLFESLHLPITYYSTDGLIITLNKLAAKTLNQKSEDIVGKYYYEVFSAETASKLHEHFQEVINSNSTIEVEHQYPVGNEERWFHSSFKPVFNDSNELIGIQMIGQDITEKKQQDAELRESEERYRNLVDNTHDLIYSFDKHGRYTATNKALCQSLNKSEKELIGKNLHELNFPPEIVMEWLGYLHQVIQSGKAVQYEQIVHQENEEARIHDVQLSPAFDQYGKVKGVRGISRDITERKQKDKILRESEERYRGLIANLPDTDVYLFDRKMTFLKAEGKELHPFDIRSEQIIGKTPAELLKEPLLYDIEHLFRQTLNGRTAEYEFEIGHQHYYHIKTVPLLDPTGYVYAGLALAQDITSRKRHELQLAQSSQRLNNILESISDGFFAVDRNFKITYFNQAAENLLGIKKERVLNKALFEVFHEAKGSIFEEKYTNALNSQKPKFFEVYFDAPPYQNWYACRVYPFANGISVYFQVTTEKRNAEHALRQSEERLRTLVETIDHVFWIRDLKNGKMIYISPCYENVFGVSKETAYKQPGYFLQLVHPADRPIVERDFKRSLNEAIRISYRLIHPDGQERWIEVQTFIITPEGENHSQQIGIAKDISIQKNQEVILLKAKDKAESADKMKTAFLSNLSHELRTPMNGILGFSELLERENLSKEKRRKYTSIVRESTSALLSLLSNMIDISLLEAGEMEIDKVMFDLNELVDTCYTNCLTKLQDKQSPVSVEVVKSLKDSDCQVEGDMFKIQQILDCLIDNAVKFTKAGTITIGYRLKDTRHLLFFVSDTGIGIAPQVQSQIFQPFRQADEGYARLYGGTGLGLTISKALIKLMNGNIWVESAPQMGTTFYFSLPIKILNGIPVLNSKNKSEPIYQWKGKTILVVEDIMFNYIYIEESLRTTGIKIQHAQDGIEAIDIARHQHIDIVLMDIRMPRMNGYEALKIIKKEHPYLPIIAQTAFALIEDREKCLSADFDEHLTKPIDKKVLIKKLALFLEKSKTT